MPAITRGSINVPIAMMGARVAAGPLSRGTAPLAGAAVLTRPSGPRGPTRVRRPAI
jgi:hypothetical protein